MMGSMDLWGKLGLVDYRVLWERGWSGLPTGVLPANRIVGMTLLFFLT